MEESPRGRGESQRQESAPPIATVLHSFQSHMATPRAGPPPSNLQPTTITQKSPFSLISQYECHSRTRWISKQPPPSTMWPLPFAHQPGGPESSVGPVLGPPPLPQQFDLRIGTQANFTHDPCRSHRKARRDPGARRDQGRLTSAETFAAGDYGGVLVGGTCSWTLVDTKCPGWDGKNPHIKGL